MPRGENEAFKRSQGRFSRISKEELRAACSKGGSCPKATTVEMHPKASE